MKDRPSFSTNSLYAKSKYAGLDMYMSDKEGTELVEDAVTRERIATKNHQKFFSDRANRLKELGAPQQLIDNDLKLSKMTYSEFQEYKFERDKIEEEERKEFVKNNPPNQEIVKKLYEQFDREKDRLTYFPTSSAHFFREILQPLRFMSEEEFDSPSYDAVFALLFEEYQNIHRQAIEFDEIVEEDNE